MASKQQMNPAAAGSSSANTSLPPSEEQRTSPVKTRRRANKLSTRQPHLGPGENLFQMPLQSSTALLSSSAASMAAGARAPTSLSGPVSPAPSPSTVVGGSSAPHAGFHHVRTPDAPSGILANGDIVFPYFYDPSKPLYVVQESPIQQSVPTRSMQPPPVLDYRVQFGSASTMQPLTVHAAAPQNTSASVVQPSRLSAPGSFQPPRVAGTMQPPPVPESRRQPAPGGITRPVSAPALDHKSFISGRVLPLPMRTGNPTGVPTGGRAHAASTAIPTSSVKPNSPGRTQEGERRTDGAEAHASLVEQLQIVLDSQQRTSRERAKLAIDLLQRIYGCNRCQGALRDVAFQALASGIVRGCFDDVLAPVASQEPPSMSRDALEAEVVWLRMENQALLDSLVDVTQKVGHITADARNRRRAYSMAHASHSRDS